MRRPLVTVVVFALMSAALVGATPATATPATATPATASRLAGSGTSAPGTPWGPVHVLHRGPVTTGVSQATSNQGMTVVVFHEKPRSGPSQFEVAVQLPGQEWRTAISLSSGKVSRPTVIAWGAGNVSVVWQTPAGLNNWLFHLRTVAPDGTWGKPEKLTTAEFAYPWYQAAMNDKGELALAWVNGDSTDRVAIHHADGAWTSTPAVPIVHPTFQGTPFIANPLKLFLTAGGQVTDVTWGTLGSSRRNIWKMTYGADGVWHHRRIAPMDGGSLGYGWVGQAHYAADPAGDFAVIWSQRDPSTKEWSTMFRYWPATGQASAVKVLSHQACGPDEDSCGDIGMTSDGSVLIAYATPTAGDNVTVTFVRRSVDGTYTTPQTVSEPLWSAAYQGVRLATNERGDGLLSFIGGDHQQSYTEFARCPAAGACDQAITRGSDPSWLDLWWTSVGPLGEATVTWTYYYRPKAVTTRSLDAFTGAP